MIDISVTFNHLDSTCCTDCAEGFDSGFFTTDGMYTIQPEHAPQPFNIRCQMLENNARNYIYVREVRLHSVFSVNLSFEESMI